MTKFEQSMLLAAAALCLTAIPVQAQTAMTKTTTSAAMTATDTTIRLTSTTGVGAYSATAGTRTMLFVDREAMLVESTANGVTKVIRGARGTAGKVAHASGAVVYVGLDRQEYFYGAANNPPGSDPSGACTSTSLTVLPIVVVRTGDEMTCPASGPYSGLWTVTRKALPEAPNFRSLSYPTVTVTTDSTTSALTLTAAQILGGLILRDPNGAGRTDTLPTATLLLAAMPGVQVGTAFDFTIRNTADAAETITVAAGTGGTTSGTMTIAQNNQKAFRVVVTGVTSPAYTVYSLGTIVF